MIRNIILISSLFYLISCTSSDQPILVHAAKISPPKPVKTSIPVPDLEAIQNFSNFLQDLSSYQMIAAGQVDIQNQVAQYLPDSTISSGFDLHLREIGGIDTFRLVYHEYFDLYDDWAHAYLTIFSTDGTAIEAKPLRELSFEGNTSINILDDKLIEIAYHDFFDKNALPDDLLIVPTVVEEQVKKKRKRKKKKRSYVSIFPDRVEGTLYEYYAINAVGKFTPLTQANTFSGGRIFPQASFRLLSTEELEQLDKKELNLVKLEMLAEHGLIFEDEEAAIYFDKQPWYIPQHENVDSLLSDIERYNYQLLVNQEKDY